MDLFRHNPHIDCKPILKQLIPETLEKGIRLVSLQTKPTEGVRHLRLDAWYYIRAVGDQEVVRALRETGHWTQRLQSKVEELMKDQKLYHVVIRGNDPKFMPVSICNGQDVVTNYCCERIEMVIEEVEKHLFEDLADAGSIRRAMADYSFDEMLKQYYLNGKQDKDATLHLAGRFRGGSNLLHTCIKEGYLETLTLLLDEFSLESQSQAPWRVLAEPLRRFGIYHVTAFHRAVFDSRSDCLAALVNWAQRHGHDITQLRNVEEHDAVLGPTKGLTCLELADQSGNLSCYNVLAPVFGVPPKQGGADANPREARMPQMSLPRIELVTSNRPEPSIRWASEQNWEWVLQEVRSLTKDIAAEHVFINLKNLKLEDDVTESQVQELLRAGCEIEANGCTWKTDKTALNFLRVVVERLGTSGRHLPAQMPARVDIASSTAEDLEQSKEEEVDREVAQLLLGFVETCGRWVGFKGARNGLISPKQRMRLAVQGPAVEAACWAAIYATRVSAFLAHVAPDVDGDGLGQWLRSRQLMPLARAIYERFFDTAKLLSEEPRDVCQNLNPAVVPFLEMTLKAWFQAIPGNWRAWARALDVEEDLMINELAPALDLVLESILRMWKALDPICRFGGRVNVSHLVRSCVPAGLLSSLPNTRLRLEKRCVPKKEKVSLTQKTFNLKPSLRPR